jgi:Immunoglobulin-like domain of bacterial spore germination/Sporulation and spore germination
MRRLALLVTVVLAVGCGSEEATEPRQATTEAAPTTTAAQTETTPTTAETETAGTTSADTTTVSVYFLRDGRIAAARRTLPGTRAAGRAALRALAAGPNAREREAGLTTSVPRNLEIEQLTVVDGIARVDFPEANGCPSIAQIVYTLTQFPTVQRVTGNCIPASAYGNGLTRADLEEVTPQILVETPTVGDELRSPLRVTGTANTFEATFMVNVTDWDGRIVAEQFVTATSGSGERGTFDVTVPFDVDRPGGSLIVFERSAEDGSQLHVVEIPLDLQPA